MKLEEKKGLSALAVLKSYFYVRKVVGQFYQCSQTIFLRQLLMTDRYLQRCMNKVNITS